MGIYDISFKDVFRSHGRAFLRSLGVQARIKPLETDLSSVRDRRVDFLGEIDQDHLLHIEFQATPHGAMAYRMLGYFGNIIERVTADRELTDAAIGQMRIQVRQIVVYAGLKPWRAPTPSISRTCSSPSSSSTCGSRSRGRCSPRAMLAMPSWLSSAATAPHVIPSVPFSGGSQGHRKPRGRTPSPDWLR